MASSFVRQRNLWDTKAEADLFYSAKYTSPVHIDMSKLSWFPSAQAPAKTYNLTSYRPRDIKETLLRKSPSSSPGDSIDLYLSIRCTVKYNRKHTVTF